MSDEVESIATSNPKRVRRHRVMLPRERAANGLAYDATVGSQGAPREQDSMARAQKQRAAAVGVTEHGNAAVLVTVAPGGELLDRRRIDLTDSSLPTHPHHHQGSWAVGRYLNTPGARVLSLADAVALVERVRAAAAHGA